ncbi:tyrosine-type recombinase/integrase [Pseudomonadota bacterium]
MRQKLTQRLVRSVKSTDNRTRVFDTDLPGFYLQSYPSGKQVYGVEFARKRYKVIGDAKILTLDQAKTRAREILANATLGYDPKKKSSLTLRELLDSHYSPWVKVNRKTGAATVARLVGAFQLLLDTGVTSLDTADITRWKTQRKKLGRAASTINRDIVALRAMLNWAVDQGLIDENPIASAKLEKVDRIGIVRYLSPNEELRLRQALQEREERRVAARARGEAWRKQRGYESKSKPNGQYSDHLAPIVLLAMNTGLRRGEVLGLRWSDIDLVDRSLTVRASDAKSGQTRHIRLNAEAVDVLNKWRESSTAELVFPGIDGQQMGHIQRSWGGLLKAADIHGFRFHDLRHHFASRLVMAGASLYAVQKLLGHSDITMTQRYAHLAPEHLQETVDLLNNNARHLSQ